MGVPQTTQDLDKFLTSPLQKQQEKPAFGPPPPPPQKKSIPDFNTPHAVQELDSFLKTPIHEYDTTPIEKWKAANAKPVQPGEGQIRPGVPETAADQWLEKVGKVKVAGDLTLAQAHERFQSPLGESYWRDVDRQKFQEKYAGKPLTIMGFMEGAHMGIGEAMQGLVTPENLALMMAMGALPEKDAVKTLVDAGFTGQMAQGVVQGVQGAYQAYERGDAADMVRALTATSVTAGFAYMSGKQVLHDVEVRQRASRMRDSAMARLDNLAQAKYQKPWNSLTKFEKADITYSLANTPNAPISSSVASRYGVKLQGDKTPGFDKAVGLATEQAQAASQAREVFPPYIREMEPPPPEPEPRTIAAPDKVPYRPVTGGVELPENESMYQTPEERSQRYYTLEEARKRLDEERRVATQEQEARATAESENQRIARERREQFEGEKAYREARAGQRLVVTERRGLEFDTAGAEANKQEYVRLSDEMQRMAEEHMYTDVDEMMRSVETEKGRGKKLEDWKNNLLSLDQKRKELLRLSDPTALEPRKTEAFQGRAEDVKLARREADMRESAAKIEAEAKKQMADAETFEKMTAEADEAKDRAEKIRTERDQKEAERIAATAEKTEYPLGPVMDMVKGVGGNIILPDGRKIPFHYAVVPQEQLISSHDPFNNFEANPNAIQVSQGRDYKNNRESQAATIARGKNPEMDLLVNTAPTAETGPPIVRSDGQGLGGRNRINIWKLLYKNGFDDLAYQSMTTKARELGVTAEQIANYYTTGRQPVVVRVLDDPYTSAKDLAQLGRDLDRTQTMGFSEAEEAVMAGRSLSDKSLDWLSGQLDAMGDDASLRDLMRFRAGEVIERMLDSGLISPTQRAEFITPNGEMTERAKNLFESAVLGKVINDAELLSTTPKEVLRKLERSVAALARVKTAGGLWDFTPELQESLRLWKRVDSVRESLNEIGTKDDSLVDKYLNPGKYKMGTELMKFGGDTVREKPHPTVEALAKLLEKPAKEIKFAIGDYADDAEGKQITLGPPPNPAESFNRNIASKVGVDVPDEAYGVMRPKEAVSDTKPEEVTPEPVTTPEPKPEPTPSTVPPDFEGYATGSSLEALASRNPAMAPVAKELVGALEVVIKNSMGMDLDEFLKKNKISVRDEGTVGEGAISQAAGSVAGWARGAGRKLSITPYGEQLDLFGGAEPQFMLRDERSGVPDANKERLVLRSELIRLRDEVPRLAELVDAQGNILQNQLFGPEEENLFGPGPEEDTGGPQGTLFQEGEIDQATRRAAGADVKRDALEVEIQNLKRQLETASKDERFSVVRKLRDAEDRLAKLGETLFQEDRSIKDIADPARDTRILNEVRAEHPEWSLSKQLQEAAKRVKDQPLRQGRKGATEFLEDGRTLITLFRDKADPSTFLHEFFHVMRRYLKPEDSKILEDWLKIKDGLWQRDDEEKAARAWEYYHREAPAQSLPEKVAAVFKKIQNVMRQVYERLKGSPLVKPSKEVSALFDRWYGKDMEAPPAPPTVFKGEELQDLMNERARKAIEAEKGKPKGMEPPPTKEKKNEITARAKEIVNLHGQIKDIPDDIDSTQGMFDDLQRFVDKSESGTLTQDDWDAIGREQLFAEAEVPDEEREKFESDEANFKDYPAGWGASRPGDKFPVRFMPTELEIVKDHQQALREDIDGLNQSLADAKKRLEELKAKGPIPKDVADRHKLTESGDLAPTSGMAPPPPTPSPSADETKGAIAEMHDAIRDGKGNANLVGWAPGADGDSKAAMEYAKKQLEAAGWKYNDAEKQFEKDGWYAFLRSQGELSSPILQWNKLKAEPEVETPEDQAARELDEEREAKVVTVDPKRMAQGEYDKEGKKVGAGDLYNSYSGHLISEGKIGPIVTIEGNKYVTTGMWMGGRDGGPAEFNMARVYTLEEWGDKPTTTYGKALEKRSEEGYEGTFSYEGIKVKKGKQEFVLGPESERIVARAGDVKTKEMAPPPKVKAKPKPEKVEPLTAEEPQALTAEDRKAATLRGQAGVLPFGTDPVRNKVFTDFDKAVEWLKANKDKIKGAQIFALPDGRAFTDFTAKKASVLFQSDHDLERDKAVIDAKVAGLQRRLQGIMSDAERANINRQIRDLKAKQQPVEAKGMEPPPGHVISLWTPEGERPVEVKRESPQAETRPSRKVPDESIRLDEPERPRGVSERPAASRPSGPDKTAGGGVRTPRPTETGRPAVGEPRTTLRDVRPVAVAPVRPRGEPAYSESDWSGRVEKFRLPDNAPAPTVQISDDLARMLMPGQREIVESVLSGLDQHDGYILATTTGTGKTYMGSAVMQSLQTPQSRMLILTPNQELIHGRDGWIRVAGNFGMEVKPMPVGELPTEPGVYIATWAGALNREGLEHFPWDFVMMDEVQEARKWWISQRGDMSKTMGDNAKKILYTSATPFHTALEIGHMGKLKLWGNEGFEMWAKKNGLGVYRDKAGNLAGGNAPLRLEKLRQQLIERGQMINIDRNMDGYSAHFGVVPMDGKTAQGLKNIDEALRLAENYFARSKPAMVAAVGAQRTTLAKRWLEYQRLPQAIELGKKLEKQGWKVIFFSENKKEFTELFDFLKPADAAMGGRISDLMPKFEGTTDVLRKAFGDDVAIFAGKHSAARSGEIEAFNDDTKSHVYATYGAGGVGVSMHDRGGDKPRAVIYLGPPWSGISFDQALGRPWRYGTKSDVRAYFLFSDSQAEMDLVTNKVAPRMESLRAMVSGVNFADPVVKNLRAVPENMAGALDYDHGNAHEADFNSFTQKRDTGGVSSYSELPITSAEEAKNKGMKLPGSEGAQDPSVIRLWQDSEEDDVLPADFEAPELTLGRTVNVELAQRFIDTGAAPGNAAGRRLSPTERRQVADAVMARAEAAASKDPASATQQVYTEWENGMKQIDAILSGENDAMEPPPPPPGEGIANVPGAEEPPKPQGIGKWKAADYYLLTNGRDVIRDVAKKAGTPEIGEKIARSIAQYHVESGNISGPWTTRYWDILKENKITPEEHKVLALTLANREKQSSSIDKQLAELRAKTPMNERIEKAVKQTQDLFKEVFNRMQGDNIYLTVYDAVSGKPRQIYYNEFASGEGYWPRKYDYEADHRVRDPETGVETVFNLRNLTRGEIGASKREAIIKGMMDRYGLSRSMVEDFLQSKKRDVPLVGHIERAREVDMPFFRTDPEVVISYLEGAGELLSRKKYFEQDGSKVKGLIAQIPDQKARNITSGIVESLLKRNPMEDESHALLRYASDWSVMKMTFSAIKVLGHPIHGSLMTNLRSFGKALFEGTTGYGDAVRRAQLAGSIQEQTKVEMLSEFGIHKKGLSTTLLKWNGWQGAYKWGRVVADANARVFMTDYAMGKLLKDPKDPVVRRQLKEFMQLDDSKIDAAIARRRWDEADLAWAGKAFSDKVMFTFDPTELPPLWRARAGAEHPAEDFGLAALRMATLLKGYQFKTHALLKDAIWDEAKKGNFRPLIPFLALYPAAGFLIHSLTALATANSKYFKQLMDDKSWTPGRTLWRVVDEIAHMVGDTSLTAFLDAAVHGKDALAGKIGTEYIVGALPTDFGRTLVLPSEIRHAKSQRAKEKVVKRYVEGTFPAARTMINVMEPPPEPVGGRPLPHVP